MTNHPKSKNNSHKNITESAKSKTFPQKCQSQYGEHLYLKGNIYYFRYVLSTELQKQFGRTEFRLSLGTGLKRDAKRYAKQVHAKLLELINGALQVDYSEIRMRMNGLLRSLLEQEGRSFIPPKELHAPEAGINLSPPELSQCQQSIITHQVNDVNSILLASTQCIPHLIEIKAFKPNEITSDNILIITKEFMKMQASYHDIIAKRFQGDYLAEQVVFNASYIPFPPNTASRTAHSDTIPTPKANLLSLSNTITKYIETKITDGAWGASSLPDHRQRLATLLEIVGDKPIQEVSREDMRNFRDTLRKLPPNRNKSKAYRGKSIKEIIKMKPKQALSVKTVNITVEAAASMFEWCCRESILEKSPAKGLQIKDTRQAIELREAFSLDDLQKIFSAPQYLHDTFKHPSHFWMPIIGLYTGMRREEIAQLHISDIYQDDKTKIWCFDINELTSETKTSQKRLKNRNAKRIIPIHAKLIEIGLLNYVDRVKKSQEVRLFPELQKTKSSQKFGHQPGKIFSDLIKQQKIVGKKTFHSLRHTFSDFFKVRLLHNDIFRQIYGHEIPDLAGKQYGSKFSAETCYQEIISKIDFKIEIETIKKSRHCK